MTRVNLLRAIIQTDRYGDGWPGAPERIEITGGTLELARHLAHIVQEWGWPGQENMFEVDGDDNPPDRCKCGALL